MPGPKITVAIVPFDNFGGRSKVRYGVGEQLKVDVKVEPAPKPPTPLEWVVKSGPASVHNAKDPGAGTIACGNKAGTVVLELRDEKAKQVVATKRFEVVAPTGAKFKAQEKKVTGGAGFIGEIFLEPFDVSFKAVEMREGAAPYEGKGCFKQVEVSRDELADSYAVIHPVLGDWIKCTGGATKNKMVGADTVSTAVSNYGQGGEFVWNIPWFYRVHGVAGDFRFTTAVHRCVIDASGKMTLSKLNIKMSKQV